ncbi:MAG: InlB B-repeat-containing protein [Clostridia bacterium]|nr:InlB B-repeat-containing protein [Clostridia bacterium]
MYKRIIRIIAVFAALAVAVFAFSACGGTEKITVSFVQDGRETIVIEIEKGGALSVKDVPVPFDNAKHGYKTEWDRRVFKNITENITVNAVEVPESFVVMYDVDGGEPIENGKFVFDAPYTLPTPVKDGFKFKGWFLGAERLEDSGVWNIVDNITLKAVWE